MDTLTEMRKEYLRVVAESEEIYIYKHDNVKFNIKLYIKTQNENLISCTCQFPFYFKANI